MFAERIWSDGSLKIKNFLPLKEWEVGTRGIQFRGLRIKRGRENERGKEP